MLELADLTALERSLAMAPLSVSAQQELIDTCRRLLADRAAIREVLDRLPEPVGDVRAALNRLHRLVR